MESESKTDRKAFLGDFIKAEKYSQELGINPTSIIVMTEKDNTTLAQVHAHLIPYVRWVRSLKGVVSVPEILVISYAN